MADNDLIDEIKKSTNEEIYLFITTLYFIMRAKFQHEYLGLYLFTDRYSMHGFAYVSFSIRR